MEKIWYQAGLRSLEYIPDDAEFAVFGAGRTVCQALRAFYEQGFKQAVVCGSQGTKDFALDLGVDVAEEDALRQDAYVYIDGADQIYPDNNLIKGGYKGTGDPGIEGCMYREKMLAYHSKQFIVIADDTKLVDRLGQDGYKLPVEVSIFDLGKTKDILDSLLLPATVRKDKEGAYFTTENGNHILDSDMEDAGIYQLRQLEEVLESKEGIFSTGLFAKRKPEAVIIASEEGVYVR